MKHLTWLSLIAISLFALACSSAPAPVAPQAQQRAAPAPQVLAPAQAAAAPQAPRAPAASAPVAVMVATAAPIVAPPQAPVTKAAPGKSAGQTAHINLAGSQVDMRWRDSLTKLRTILNG